MAAAHGSKTRGRISWGVRLAASALVLTIIFSLVPLSDVLAAIRNVEPSDWLIALVVFLIGHVVSAAKCNCSRIPAPDFQPYCARISAD